MNLKQLSSDSILRIKGSILLRRLGDSRLQLYNIDEQKMFSLSDLGAYLLIRLDGAHSLSEVIDDTQRILAIDDQRFPDMAVEFFTAVFLAQLLEALPAKMGPAPRLKSFEPSSITRELSSLKIELYRPDVAMAGGCVSTGASTGACASGGPGAGPGTGATGAHSDRRLKTNITTLEAPIEKIQALRGVRFSWKDSGQEDVGFIAQEVETVFPELVLQIPGEEFKRVKYGNIVAVVIEAVKVMWSEITGQNSRIAKLEALVDRLQADLEARPYPLNRQPAKSPEKFNA